MHLLEILIANYPLYSKKTETIYSFNMAVPNFWGNSNACDEIYIDKSKKEMQKLESDAALKWCQ